MPATEPAPLQPPELAAAAMVLLDAVTPVGTDPLAVPRRLTTQKLVWRACYPAANAPKFQCATLIVPRDWAHPATGTLKVGISRVVATKRSARRGVLLTNPGGPGVAGLLVPLFLAATEPSVNAVYDIVGIDPRGVGRSTALHCADPALGLTLANLDGRDVSEANQARILTLSRQYAQTCAANSLARVIDTPQTVRDLELLRTVLGVSKVSYLGYSYGSWLGAQYAAAFPTRVDRFALDGNLDFTSALYQSQRQQPAGFQYSYEHYFLPWAARYDATFRLGLSAAAVRATIEARRAALARTPIQLLDGSLLTASQYDYGLINGLYSTSEYSTVAAALTALESWATASDALRVLVTVTLGGASFSDPYWATLCQDSRPPTVTQVQADTSTFRSTAALAGSSWNAFPCMYWPTPAAGGPVSGARLPALLMVNNADDPATPLSNARAARRHTPKARLVTVSRQPDHTVYASGNTCVDCVVNAWLIRGVLPAADITCSGLPLPDPATEVAAGLPLPAPTPTPTPTASPALTRAVTGASRSAASLPLVQALLNRLHQPDLLASAPGAGVTVRQWISRVVAAYGLPQTS